MKEQVKTVIILVELENGDVHQVNATDDKKHKALQQCLKNGVLQIFDKVEPYKIHSFIDAKKKTYDA